jgi:hypothetical protein
MPDSESATLRIAVCFRIQFTTSSPIFQDFQGVVNTGAEERSRLLAYLERVPNWFDNPEHVWMILSTVKNFIQKWAKKGGKSSGSSSSMWSDVEDLLDVGVELLASII